MGKMKEKLTELRKAGQLLVGIGPMSRLCVDAAYRYSHENSQPIMLIASRRQVECAALGHGYVNNWTTEGFGAYCTALAQKFPKSEVFLCRDHGGPWQGDNEDSLSLEEAMKRAISSYEADILSGFHLLHIDPSLCRDGNLSMRAVVENTIKLLRHCSGFAKENNKDVEFEIGTEENSGSITTNESFAQLVRGIAAACARDGIEKPIFVVGQTQSLVKEMRQVGEFNEANTAMLIGTAAGHGFLLKEHNADYLSEYQLRQRIKAGVPAMNVAPELGVLESSAFVDFCMKKGNAGAAEKFLRLSVQSGKWKKWVLNPDTVSYYDKAIISGHYVFAKKEFDELKQGLDANALEEEISKALHRRLEFYFARNRKLA